MAKQRSGLGRGLGSLLGAAPEGSMQQELEQPVERNHPNVPVPSNENQGSVKQEPAVPVYKKDDSSNNEEGNQKPENLYSNKEDHITIKGVVERERDSSKAGIRPNEVIAKKDGIVHPDTAEVDLSLIVPNPNQPRTNFKKEELDELAESIKKNGLLQPILVRRVGDQYQIIAGERRWQACKKLGLKKVPIRIKEANDDETIILALVENIQRSDLNPIEEAYGYRRMMERGKMTQSEVAQAVSKGRSTIANSLRLLELPEDAQQLLFEERITAGHARAILSIPNQEGRKKLTEKLVEGNLSVREAEAFAKSIVGKEEKKPAEPKPQAPKSYKTVARALKDTLATEVKIKSIKGKNKIEIDFKDEADLERLFRIISKSSL